MVILRNPCAMSLVAWVFVFIFLNGRIILDTGNFFPSNNCPAAVIVYLCHGFYSTMNVVLAPLYIIVYYICVYY